MGDVISVQWCIRWTRGTETGWYTHLGKVGLGTESEARDKAERLNDKDVGGMTYRAERYVPDAK